MKFEIAEKGEILKTLDEKEKWYKEETCYEVYHEDKKWASVGQLDELIDFWVEKRDLEWSKETTYELELKRKINRAPITIAGSRFRKKLLIRVLGCISNSKKKRLTLKNDDSKLMKKYTGDTIQLKVKHNNYNPFYPVVLIFDEKDLGVVLSPMIRD